MDWISKDFLISLILGFNYFVIFYFAFTNTVYFVLLGVSTWVAFTQLWKSRFAGYQEIASSPIYPPISILVPANNEKLTIVETVRSLLNLEYPVHEVIVINDGSTDGTLETLVSHFGLRKVDLIYRPIIPTSQIRGFYIAPQIHNLTVIDKQLSGKPDSLNVGINASRSPYFCSVDADTILEKDALLRIIKPILEPSEQVVASGGIVRVLDGCTVERGQVTKIDLPKRGICMYQVVEYIRSFLFGRTGWSTLNCLIVLSGAFSVFQKRAVQESGGYGLDTVTEDFEMIIRLHRYFHEKDEKYKILFVPEPVAWTQVPNRYVMLARQRRRWQRGLASVLLSNIRMFFNPRYGWIGLFAIPYNFFVELLGPAIEFLGYIVVILSFYFSIINLEIFLLFLFLALLYGIFLSVGAILIEEITYRRYPKGSSLIKLMIYGVLENLGYRQINAWWRLQALVQFILRKDEWERARRRSFKVSVPRRVKIEKPANRVR